MNRERPNGSWHHGGGSSSGSVTYPPLSESRQPPTTRVEEIKQDVAPEAVLDEVEESKH